MQELTIICGAYSANSACSNHELALLHGFDECGVFANVYFVRPGKFCEKVEDTFQNIKFHYLWEGKKRQVGFFATILSFIDVYKLTKKLKHHTTVLCFDSDRYLPIVTRNKKIVVYHEMTEHPSIIRSVPNFWYKRYLKSCSKLECMFVISERLKDYYQKLGCKRVEIINMVVDSNRFYNLSKQRALPKYIAYCGNGANNKDGVDRLIKAYAMIAANNSDTDLMIIGPYSTDASPNNNRQLAIDLEIGNRVRFTGVVAAPQIPQLLKDAEMLVLARPDSLQAQCGFPTKLGEYLLTGNPVVVTRVGDMSKFLEHKVSALIADENNVEDLARCMQWVIDNPKDAQIIGEKGREVALKDFNYKTEAKKMLAAMMPV